MKLVQAVKSDATAPESTKELNQLREENIAVAKAFKASWVDIAQRIYRVKKDNLFLTWGFESLEDYAAKDLKLSSKRVTALIGGLDFLERHEPEALKNPAALKAVPPQEVVEMLAKIEEKQGAISDKEYQSYRETMMDEEVSVDEKLSSAKEKFVPKAPPKTDELNLQSTAASARRVADALAKNSLVPEKLRTEAMHLANALESLFSKQK